MTDEELVSRMQAGDTKAFREIYVRYWKVCYKAAFAETCVREEAEDIVHNLFESLWRNRNISSIKKLPTYLMVSVKYLAYAHMKAQINFRKYYEYLLFQNIYQENSAENIVDHNDLQKALEAAMQKLPEKTVEIFKMSRFKNKSVAEIARELNLTEKAIEYHITKSLKVLKEQLDDFRLKN